MLDLRRVVAEAEQTKAFLKNRQAKDLSPIDDIVKLDLERKTIIQKVEDLKHERNQASSEIATKKRAGEDASEILEKMKTVANEVKQLDSELALCDSKIQGILSHIPNRLHASVPVGTSEADNREERTWGTLPTFDFEPASHYEIGEKMGILNFLKAGEVTGARFVFLKGIAARLERALIDFMINVHSNHGYEEIQPPFIVNRDALFGTGQLPKFEEDVFKIEGHEFFLTPTAEVPVTNFHRNEILDETQLPIRYVAYSPCFRSEAGSYGKDTKGLKRQHQFEKVELVKFSQPEKSYEELDKMCGDAERILQLLNLPYRVISLCSADIGFSAAKTYDIEVWSPFSNSYVEISSCSNCEDFQARRANIRYRNANKKVQHVHTLNGSGLAIGRTMLAIMENYQTKDGTFIIPDALKPYLD